jgi:hypothetical protein
MTAKAAHSSGLLTIGFCKIEMAIVGSTPALGGNPNLFPVLLSHSFAGRLLI